MGRNNLSSEEDMTQKSIRKILQEFDAKDEQELYDNFNNQWKNVECIFCGKEIDLMRCGWSNGDPCCKGGCA